MGWFDEQIRQRISKDEQSFSDAFSAMAGVITDKRAFSANASRSKYARAAVDEILQYYHAKPNPRVSEKDDLSAQLDDLLRPSGIMRRTVDLPDGWWRDCVGPMLAETVDGGIVALMPGNVSGYTYFDYTSGRRVRINRKTNENLSGLATCFYRPLPFKKLNLIDLLRYRSAALSIPDYAVVIIATLAVTFIGMLLPYINSLLFDQVVPSGQMSLILPIACLLVGVTVSSLLINLTKAIVASRLSTKTDIAIDAAAMMRVLSMPTGFFQTYSPGDLYSRLCSVRSLNSMIGDATVVTGLSSIFSLVYITQMMRYGSAIAVPALLVIIATVIVSLLSSLLTMKISSQRMEASAKLSGLELALINGVQKIKLAGAEKRAFAKWAGSYAEKAKLQYNPPLFIKLSGVYTTAITLVGTIVIYFFAVNSSISAADYMAFNVSYGMVSAAFSALASIVLTAADIKPALRLVDPIFKTVPEVSSDKATVARLSGTLEFNNVSFRYTENGPLILDDFSLKIRAGQYVAIVGRTGCGKSTIIRLMLGFEKPVSGAIYYDGMDLNNLNPESLRRHIGVVLQDGKLFPDTIFNNISISAPNLTMDEAWEAAAMSGIDKDIKAMPMGMHTLISGGSGGISGGQAQRLMIARAIAPKPRILIFDEATSALDNITQHQVSEALNSLKCTRIVVAHRLSTIRQCSRIVVIDSGKIVQDGTYDELVQQKNGLFAELVHRQQLHPEEETPAAPVS